MFNPMHPYYCTESRRLESFETWPKGLPQKPQALVDAGFFYTGQSDRVICYFCDGKLKDWTPEDQPWIEHARWFKYCSYLIIVKGIEYVQSVSSSYEAPLPSHDYTTPVHDQLETTKIICKICLEKEVNTCFIPCGHAVACGKCALSIHKKCPICRKVYVDIIRLYF